MASRPGINAMPITLPVAFRSGTHHAEPDRATITAAAGSPTANLSVVSSKGPIDAETSRPSTVPAAHNVAAPSASSTASARSMAMWVGSGNVSSQAPARAGTANQAKTGRMRSCNNQAAPRMAMIGCSFWITAGVTGSPYRNDMVNNVVATADAPTPMPITDNTVRRSVPASARIARGRNGSRTSTRTACSASTMVGASTRPANGTRQGASVAHRAAPSATTRVRSRGTRTGDDDTPGSALFATAPFPVFPLQLIFARPNRLDRVLRRLTRRVRPEMVGALALATPLDLFGDDVVVPLVVVDAVGHPNRSPLGAAL